MARTAASRADVVFAVGGPSLKGVHGLVRVITDLVGFGVPAHRIVPVINRSPRSHRARAGLGTARGRAGRCRHRRPPGQPRPPARARHRERPPRRPSPAGGPGRARWRARSEPSSTGCRSGRSTTAPVRPVAASGFGPGPSAGGRATRPPSDGPVASCRRCRRSSAGSRSGPGDLALDMADDDGRARLRALVDDEVAAWSRDFKRGLRAFDLADPELVADAGLPQPRRLRPARAPPGRRRRVGDHDQRPRPDLRQAAHGPSGYHDEVFHDDDHVVRTLTKILDDASGSHRKLDPAEGLQDAQLDNGARLHIVHGDVGRDGHVLVNIRKFTGVPFRALDELVERDMLDTRVADFLRACVRARLSIVFAGAPGLGQDHAAVVLRGRARPHACGSSSPRRSSRPTSRCPTSPACRPGPPGQDRPAVDLRRLVAGLPAHGPRRRHRRRGPRPGGAAPAAHAVVGREGLHHHPRRVGPPGAHPAAVHLPAGRHVQRAADVGAQLAGERGHRHRRPLQPAPAAGRGSPRWSPSRTCQAGPDATQFTVTELFARPAVDEPLDVDRQPARPRRPGPRRGRLRRPLLLDADAERRGRRPTRVVTGLGRPSESPPTGTGRRDAALLVAVAGACGVLLLYTAVVLGWTGVGVGPPRRRPAARAGAGPSSGWSRPASTA